MGRVFLGDQKSFLHLPFALIMAVMTSLRLFPELFWSVFSLIWTENREIMRICPYSVRMLENARPE